MLHTKLYEDTPLHSFNVTHASTKNHQVRITFMESKENILINTEKMIADEHALVLIKKQIAPLNTPYQNCMKTLLFVVLMSLMLAQKIIK